VSCREFLLQTVSGKIRRTVLREGEMKKAKEKIAKEK
jgi:hypothetical protein